MIKCLNTLFCKEAKIEDDGLMSILSIYSSFSRKRMPAIVKLCFVCFLELSIESKDEKIEDEFNYRVIIMAPWGREIGDHKQAILFQQISDTSAHSTPIVEYGDVEFTEFGRYTFEV